MKSSAFLLFLFFGISEAQAASISAGAGVAQCGVLQIESGGDWRERPNSTAAVMWAQGYISGINHANSYRHARTVDLTHGKANDIWDAIVSACSENGAVVLQDVMDRYFIAHMQ